VASPAEQASAEGGRAHDLAIVIVSTNEARWLEPCRGPPVLTMASSPCGSLATAQAPSGGLERSSDRTRGRELGPVMVRAEPWTTGAGLHPAGA